MGRTVLYGAAKTHGKFIAVLWLFSAQIYAQNMPRMYCKCITEHLVT